MGLGVDTDHPNLRAEARKRGLWNLFLPGAEGAGLTDLQYAPIAEISGRSGHLAPAAMNCAAPDTGNMEVLSLFGTERQKRKWLEPLLAGEIRSAFAMTEPAVASSDATNISTRIDRDGDEYVPNGRKWWITGAMNPNAKVFIVMGKTHPSAHRHRQHSMILVERDTPGFEIHRGMHVMGYDDHEHGGDAELSFTGVRVPVSNLIAGEGDGFGIAQARLGPGRIHHCMRAIGATGACPVGGLTQGLTRSGSRIPASSDRHGPGLMGTNGVLRNSPTLGSRAVPRDEFDDAVDAVSAAAIAYRGTTTREIHRRTGSVSRPTQRHATAARPLRRPVSVAMRLVLGKHPHELSLSEDQHAIYALVADSADPPLGIGVGHWRLRRAPQHGDADIGEHVAEAAD